MARRAGNSLVKSLQRELCRIVVKLHDAPEQLPGREGVAVDAGDLEIAVRTVRRVQLSRHGGLLSRGGLMRPGRLRRLIRPRRRGQRED